MAWTLGRDAVLQIQQLVRAELLKIEPMLRARLQHNNSTQPIYIAKSPAGGIPAISSDTPGTASVTLYKINSDGDLVTADDQYGDSVDVTAYNLASSAVAGDTYIQLKQEVASGKLLVDFEDCG